VSTALHALIVEDSEDDTALIVRELQRGGYDVIFERVDTSAAMSTALDRQTWDVVICDYVMPQFSAPAALELLKENDLDLPFIIVSGRISEDIAVAAMKAGAHDYILKNNLTRLVAAVERELREVTVRQERKRTAEALRRAQQALNVLSKCNQALVRAMEESDLLNQICRIIVEVGQYRLAWIGFAEKDEKKTVRPVAQRGYEEGYLDKVNITWGNAERGRGPTGTAIRTGKPSICKNILNDPNFAPWCVEAAKRGYASVIGIPLIANGQTFGALTIYAPEADAFDAEETQLLMELADDLAYGIVTLRTRTEHQRAKDQLEQNLEKLRKTLGGIIQAMALTVEARDPYTAGHQRRVSDLARTIAKEMGLSQDQIDGIRMAGIIHDLGKISIPAEILSKPGRIGEYEFGIIKTHPKVGYEILKEIEFPWPVAQIVLQHHERMNGSGYPQGLFGDEILLEARILGVADVIEAMASHRPYRPALGINKALEEISQNKGILYDPQVVDACLKLFIKKGYKFK